MLDGAKIWSKLHEFFGKTPGNVLRRLEKAYLYSHIKLVWLFSSTPYGYTLYTLVLLLLYGNSGHQRWYPATLLFALYLVGTSFNLFLLLRHPFLRKRCSDLVGSDFIKRHLGNPGEAALKNLIAPILGLAAGNECIKQVQLWRNRTNAELVDTMRQEMWRESGHLPTMSDREQLLQEKQRIVLQPTTGLEEPLQHFGKVVKDWFSF